MPEWAGAHLPVDHMGFCAIVIIDARKFQCNVATANDGQLLWDLWKVQNLITDDGVLCTLNGQLGGAPAGGYEDVLGLHTQTGALVRGQGSGCAQLQVPNSSHICTHPSSTSTLL